MRSAQALPVFLTIFLAVIFQCTLSTAQGVVTQTGKETIESYDPATEVLTISVQYSYQWPVGPARSFTVEPNLIGNPSFSPSACTYTPQNRTIRCPSSITSFSISYRYRLQINATEDGKEEFTYLSLFHRQFSPTNGTYDLVYPSSWTYSQVSPVPNVSEPGHFRWEPQNTNSFVAQVRFQARPPERLTMVLLPEDPKAVVWANGHEEFKLFAILTKEGSVPVSGQSIQLKATPTTRTIITPASGVAITDNFGVATFTVTSARVGEVNFTATHLQTLTAMATVKFVERRVAVIIQGTNSSLNPENDQGIFPEIRDILVNDLFYRSPIEGMAEARAECANTEDDDGDGVPNDGCPLILNYSYWGGSTDIGTGIWQPYDYTCNDTAQDLLTSIEHLRLMLKDFATANPNTRFVIIGHSQGGLITLQGLRFTSLPIDSAIMLAGALGGVPEEIADASGYLPDFVFCWGDPASDQMVQIWNSTSQHNRQGSTARLSPFSNNTGLVRAAQRQGTRVMTIGSTDDCLFNPARCLDLGFSSDNTSTAIVEQADVSLLLALGENCPSRSCSRESHRVVRTHPTVLQMIKEFVGPSLIE